MEEIEVGKISPAEGLRLLAEASSDSLTELMSRNPLEMTEEHISQIVEEYRQMRARWSIAELAGKKSLPKVKPALPKPSEPAAPKDLEF